MNVEEKWAEMVSTSKDNIETFNDFFEDKATVWANSEIRRLRAESAMAQGKYLSILSTLSGIHALLYPPKQVVDGVEFEFHSPHVHEQMQALSDRIRRIPEEISKVKQ